MIAINMRLYSNQQRLLNLLARINDPTQFERPLGDVFPDVDRKLIAEALRKTTTVNNERSARNVIAALRQDYPI